MPLSDFCDLSSIYHTHPFFTLMNSAINVYEYPENANPRDLLAYRTAVQQAFLEGRPIEMKVVNGFSGWAPCETPLFLWDGTQYRVARPKLAAGRNEAGLTEEQVGVKDGWRLLTQAEHEPENRDIEAVQFFKSDKTWSPTGSWRTGHEDLRTQKPAGFFLLKKDRFFRHKNGLFSGNYCIRVKATCSDYPHLDGRIEQPAMDSYWSLEECLLRVAGGHWVEFDGDLSPWRNSVALAVGHNPDNLTETQVSIYDGWRLLSLDEINHRRAQRERDLKAGVRWLTPTKNIQRWDPRTQSWDERPYYGADPTCTFRTKFAPGHFLPKNLTIEGWLRTLPDGYRERALKNMDTPHKRCDGLATAIGLGFLWRRSPEGFAFWSDVQDHFRYPAKRALPPLPIFQEHTGSTRKPTSGVPGVGLCESLLKSIKGQPASTRPKLYTPWTLETIPLPCVLRRKDTPGLRFVSVLAKENGLAIGSRPHGDLSHDLHSWQDLFDKFEVSLDHGKTWSIAGREGV